MAIKFNSEECCHDSVFNEELPTRCKKATTLLYNKNTHKFNSINVGVVWGRGHGNWGRVNYRVWFVPEAILEKLEPML